MGCRTLSTTTLPLTSTSVSPPWSSKNARASSSVGTRSSPPGRRPHPAAMSPNTISSAARAIRSPLRTNPTSILIRTLSHHGAREPTRGRREHRWLTAGARLAGDDSVPQNPAAERVDDRGGQLDASGAVRARHELRTHREQRVARVHERAESPEIAEQRVADEIGRAHV